MYGMDVTRILDCGMDVRKEVGRVGWMCHRSWMVGIDVTGKLDGWDGCYKDIGLWDGCDKEVGRIEVIFQRSGWLE